MAVPRPSRLTGPRSSGSHLIHGHWQLRPTGSTQVPVSMSINPPSPADNQIPERGFDLCFLLGQQGQPDSSEFTKAEDKIRHALNDSGLDYQVLYGSSEYQLATIVNAVASLVKAGQAASASTRPVCNASRNIEREAGRLWAHTCERCSDPHSERSLLSGLAALRAQSASAHERR